MQIPVLIFLIFQKEVSQKFPEPGFVEMSPMEIYDTTLECIEGAINKLKAQHGISADRIKAVGISNQRGENKHR
jgi:glycerol kinase